MKTLIRIISDNPSPGQDSIKEYVGLEVSGHFLKDGDNKPNGKISAYIPERGTVVLNEDEYEIV